MKYASTKLTLFIASTGHDLTDLINWTNWTLDWWLISYCIYKPFGLGENLTGPIGLLGGEFISHLSILCSCLRLFINLWMWYFVIYHVEDFCKWFISLIVIETWTIFTSRGFCCKNICIFPGVPVGYHSLLSEKFKIETIPIQLSWCPEKNSGLHPVKGEYIFVKLWV